MFPSSRFRLAGATDLELAALEAEHNSLPAAMQAANEQHFQQLDTAGLAQALDVRRGAGIPVEGVLVTDEPLPDLPESAYPEGAQRVERELDPDDLAAVNALLDPPKPKRTRKPKAQ